jgi:NADH dehydrogenase FAD-containing subunit
MENVYSESTTNIILVGGGHVNVQVMVSLYESLKPEDNCKLILISDYEFSYYSGMLPGCIAQLYQKEQVQRSSLVCIITHLDGSSFRLKLT